LINAHYKRELNLRYVLLRYLTSSGFNFVVSLHFTFVRTLVLQLTCGNVWSNNFVHKRNWTWKVHCWF